MSTEDPIVIVGMARTPMGALLGELSPFSANELGAEAVKAALAEAGVAGDDVDMIYMGNVLGAGQGQAPARQSAIKAGLPKSVEATTLNKMCGSGMQAAIMGRAAIRAGDANVLVAGGMESMTNAPHLLPNHRSGFKYGHDVIKDHMAQDGLEDAYEKKAMGVYADMIAQENQFTREDQDAYAIETLKRAQKAGESGAFKREITALTHASKKGDVTVDTDELPRRAKPDKIPSLRPAFSPDGTVTAANASAISDGAAALVMMRLSEAERRGLAPIAKIVSTAGHAHEPAYFTTAPVPAMRKVMEKAGWSIGDVDLWEINEAFAVVPMIAIKELGLSHENININGGACALGHPIGASGARILVTLLAALENHDLKRGVASLCIGGGEATAVAVERMS
ncbi:acetyl-CoA acetyltransferase [Marinicauda pacifica]|jgi:acetyl-CoA C-acetyltransferase|uniref:Acetyl-CoA C-acyltransferase n=1 Tax=Marinicauda pacifica TaxID=1133559 RepID=A0A4S2HDA7_9PROT|nr:MULTISPECIES: acetyl-CoA C-acyltransferase [Marinicauda]TGY93741.1 acetyl-CoA C-acyltransferase [Marinicauda pacifica]GGE29930.1 acetyl-CoA acetyltransferase [Marinicauda pacifica]